MFVTLKLILLRLKFEGHTRVTDFFKILKNHHHPCRMTYVLTYTYLLLLQDTYPFKVKTKKYFYYYIIIIIIIIIIMCEMNMSSQIWVNPYLGNYTPMCIIISKCGHLYFPLSPHASSPRHSPHFPSPHFSSQLTKHPLGLTSPHPTFTSPHLQIPSLYNHLPITLDFHHPIFPSPYLPSSHLPLTL